MEHQQSCFFFPLRNAERLRESWCSVKVDPKLDGTISWESLYSGISNHGCFDVPSFQLDLVLYNVSHLPLLRRHLESDQSINLDTIKEEAPRISSSDSILTNGSCYLVAVDAARPPIVAHPPAIHYPNMTSVPKSQLPSPVGFPKTTNASLSLPNVQALLDFVVIRVRTAIKDADKSDCVANNITIDMTSVHPEWVESFVRQMSRRREITSAGFQYLLQHAESLGGPSDGLTQSIYDRFVCNDDKPVVTSTGQTVRSRSSEGGSYISTLKQDATDWSLMQVLHLLETNFAEVARTNKGNQQLKLIAQKDEHLPNGLGIPVMNAESVTTWYSPKPDASLFRGFEPYLFVEVESKDNDYERMLLYGASLVRWISRVCQYRFILPLLFVYATTGETELLYMYDDDDNAKVQCLRLSYNLNSLQSRLELLATIYNIIDREPIQTLHETLRSQLDDFKRIIPASGLTTISTDTVDPDHSASAGHSRPRSSDKDVNIGTLIDRDDNVHETKNDNDDEVENDEGDSKAKNKRGKKRRADSDGGRSGGGRGPRGGGGGGGGSTRSSGARGPKGDGGGGGGSTRSSGARGPRGGGGGGRAGSKKGAGGSRAGRSARAVSKRNSGEDEGILTRSKTRSAEYILTRAGYRITLVPSVDSGKDVLRVTKKFRNFVVKIARKTRERKFYSIQLEHPNIIQPEEVFTNFDWDLVVLPELIPLNTALNLPNPKSSAIRKFLEMSHDLASGLQCLHDAGIAHLDIKPSNLVYHPTTFLLQIIDFNSAVWVVEPDETISGPRGTFFWMAPEVSKGTPFKPILADRYSCGVVFHQMAGAVKDAGVREHRRAELQSFAFQLMNANPCLRPALNTYAPRALQLVNC